MKRLLAVLLLVFGVRAFAQTTPTITWNTPAPIDYGVVLGATQLDATASVAGTFTYSPSAGTVLSPGAQTLSVTFTPNDTTDYTTAIASVQLTVLATPAPGILATVAGNGGYGAAGDGGPATAASFSNPQGLAMDSAGNYYIADPYSYDVRKVTVATGIITTVAGTGTGGYSGDGGPATAAQLSGVTSVAIDSAGNLYIADPGNAVIRKVTASTGIITTIVGNGQWGYSGDGGPALQAEISGQLAVAVDAAGNLYIADGYNMVVRKVSASTGIITTIAGNGTTGYTGDGGPATSAELNWPYGVAVDSAGNVYIADLSNNVVREVTASSGIITTVAGNGTQGYEGDGGAALSSELNQPEGVSLDSAGNLYISDTGNNVIREVSSGTITTIAGNGAYGYGGDGGPAIDGEFQVPSNTVVDAAGDIYIADFANHVIREVGSLRGTSLTVNVSPVTAMLYAGQQEQFSAAVFNTSNTAVNWSISPTGGSDSITSSGLYTAPATVNMQQTVTITATSQADTSKSASATVTILRPIPSLTVASSLSSSTYGQPVTFTATISSGPTGTVTFFADGGAIGTGTISGGQATYTTSTLVVGSHSITASWPGNSNYAPALSSGITQTVSQTTPTLTWNTPSPIDYGVVLGAMQLDATTSVAGTFTYTPSAGTVLSPGAQTLSVTFTPSDTTDYTTATDSVQLTVLSTLAPGIIATVAGNWDSDYPSGDGGPATAATFSNPQGLAMDSAGNYYIADPFSYDVRKVTAATGIITTVAGTGTGGYSGDGGPATAAQLSGTTSVAVDSVGNLYIADDNNVVIRKVTASTGIITTIAGNGRWGYSGDGGPALSAELANQLAVAVDGAGNLYIADGFNMVVRKVSASTGIITTIAGNGTAGYTGDGGPATSAELNWPYGVAVDSAGNVYIADLGNNVIREVTPSGTITTVAGNGTQGYKGDGSSALSAELNQPQGVSLDSAGNLYISDTGNNVIREVSSGTITTVAGNGVYGYSGDGGPAIDGELEIPSNTVVDAAGNIYIADFCNHVIREVGSVAGLVTVSVSPQSATLYAGQQTRFSATVTNTSNTAVSWTVSPAGAGTIDSSGNYTAPSLITTEQTITITVQSQANPSATATATVTLLPPIVVTVSPATATLSSGGQQRFTASVTNTSNTAVNWTVSPADAGVIDSSGNYVAPSPITAQQTITVTATSQADGITSGTATVTLIPSLCSPSGYGYGRAIAIDHTKVPNTDQTNFPFLFNTTDPLLKTTANGGHVANGNDIIFTSDPAGQNLLNYEIEEYNSTTGQLVAWVQIPNLSHTSDTVIYLFYGNPNITASQANSTGVWDSNYLEVLHMNGDTGIEVPDSTANGNNGTKESATSPAAATSGLIANSDTFDGDTSYVVLPPSMTEGLSTFSASLWVQTTDTVSNATYWNQPNFFGDSTGGNASDDFGVTESGGDLGIWSGLNSGGDNSFLTGDVVSDGKWHRLDAVNDGTMISLYLDGANVDRSLTSGNGLDTYGWYLGAQHYQDGGANFYIQGNLEEFHFSKIARSADWIATEYANQNSPSTSYILAAENAEAIVPSSIALYPSQLQQFVISGVCNAASISWTMPQGSPGMLSSSGLYTAPATTSATQTITVTASSQTSGTAIGTASVTLLPQPVLTLAAEAQPPYAMGTSQGFIATLKNPDGTLEKGVTVTFTATGANSASGTATTDRNGIASFAYIGTNSGIDTIQATATANADDEPVTSNSVSVSWAQPAPQSSEGSVTLQAGPALGLTGLCGAFTDINGTVIEPLAIGASPRLFVVPAGATQLQLGVVDDRYGDNSGSGFTVEVDGALAAVLPTTMPWIWVAGGLNTRYPFGLQDGTQPIVALTGLIPGQEISVVYQSGTVSAGAIWPYVDANGYQQEITGSIIGSSGTYFPTLYMSASSYPVGQPIEFTATVVNGSSNPMVNTPVFLDISGVNTQEIEATTNSAGIAQFSYVGTAVGNDVVQARALPAGETSLLSNQASVTWNSFSSLAQTGSLTLTPGSVQPLPTGGSQAFTVYATDESGAPAANIALEMAISGTDQIDLFATTDATGHAAFVYQNVHPGVASVVVTGFIDGVLAYSNTVAVPWTLPPATTTASGGSGTLSVGISTTNPVTLPNLLQLTGTATDTSLPAGSSPSVAWSSVSGPGTVTFGNAQQTSTTAAFSTAGTYVLQLSASDAANSGSAQITIVVLPQALVTQGWIGSPANGSPVSGLVPITVPTGVTLQSGTLSYYPANNPSDVTVLNSNTNTSESQQIGTFDTTSLLNGSYWITLQATDTSGNSQYSVALVTVVGNYKPGRVTTTVTDLVVPATGLSIQIQRSYDSLDAATVGDFGYGWNLGINVNLTVDNKGDVTFTLGGQRRTFYLTPQMLGCSPLIGCLFPWYSPIFTPEPGLYGTLTDSSPGCPLDMLLADNECFGGGYYNPPGYIYTDPNGTQYSISATGGLQSITDKNGNGLTITPNGITSTTGLNVPFVRDSQNRITQITDPQGNVYQYGYDSNGDLTTVTYPATSSSTICSGVSTSNTSQYTYYPGHYYESGTDGRCNPLPSTSYYAAGEMDTSGVYSVAGKLQSVSDALGETTSYAYNLSTNTTTVTYPPDANGNVGHAMMVYDSLGDLLSSTDPLGNTTINTYDANQDLLSTTDPLGHTTSYTYDSNGNKISQTYPATATSTNTTSTTAYNQYSEPISTTDELGNVRAFNYDANYNPQSVTDGLGTLMSTVFNANGTMQSGAIGYDITQNPARASQFGYDANGNLTSKTDALGRTTSYTYNSLGQKVTMIEPIPSGSTAAAATTTYTYDPFGNLTQTAAPLGRVTSSTYDANNNKLSDTDARGNTTNYKYDALNRLIETDYSDGTKSTKTYDFRNNVIDATDQDGHDTHYVYDLASRQTSVTQAYGTSNATTTSYAYDNAGRKTSEIDALGHVTNYTYDAAGNLLSTSGVQGNFSYAYDNARNQIAMTDGNGNTTQYAYDARKRLTVTTYSDTTTKTNAYDGPGNLVSVTDQAGNQVQYTYDAANQLSSVIQANSPNTGANTTSYNYDPLGNPDSLVDANSHQTIQNFDLLSELTAKTLPDGTLTETRTYDSNGNLASVTHFNGVVTTYTYDTLNRLLSRATPGETTVSLTYTATGKRATMTDASGTTTYSYDSMDRLSSKATPEGTLIYGYDSAGHVSSIASSNVNGASMSYTYDDLNRLSTVTDNRLTGSNVTTYAYDSASNIATVTYPNGVQSTFTYDTLNRMTGLSSQPASYAYQRGPTGNLTSVTESNGRTEGWTYDGIYRLTNETISLAPSGHNGSVGYGLDPVGNRLTETSSLNDVPSGTWSFNADDEISSEIYDQNGNVTTTNGKTFGYDSENHLVSMSNGSTSATLIYDGDGNRVSKTVGGVTTYYLVDDLNPTGYPQIVDELTGSTVTRIYAYGLQRINENQVLSGSWTSSFYGYDGGGNVRQLTNAAGTVTDSYEYDAYGNHWTVEGSTPNNMLYRGEEWDPDLSLVDLRARYMNPLSGRFLSRDPEDGILTDPKTLHKYLYAGGDPVNMADPTGRAEAAAPSYSPGAVEYGLLVGLISLQVAKSVPQVTEAVNCLNNLAYTYLWGISQNLGSPMTFEREDQCDEKVKSCKKASPWQLKEAGIDDAHAFKADYVGKSNLSSWDICACSDGGITISAVGQCGNGPWIDTHATWK